MATDSDTVTRIGVGMRLLNQTVVPSKGGFPPGSLPLLGRMPGQMKYRAAKRQEQVVVPYLLVRGAHMMTVEQNDCFLAVFASRTGRSLHREASRTLHKAACRVH